MFDIGFLEIVVVLIITLLVVGPERMPEIARKAGQLAAKARGFLDSVKNDSDLRETVRELQDSLNIKEEQEKFNQIQNDLYKGFEDVRDEINFDELQRPFGGEVNPEPVFEPSKAEIAKAREQLAVSDDAADATDSLSEQADPTRPGSATEQSSPQETKA